MLVACVDPLMRAIECPSCALQVTGQFERCPFCDYEFPRRSRRSQTVAWVMVLLLAWPVFEVLSLILR